MTNLPPLTEQHLMAIVQALRAFGFFPDERLSDAAVLSQIYAFYGADWPELLASIRTPAALDMFLLWPDQSRVWCRDLECVYPGEDAYATSLREWAAISRDQFAPEQIRETWQTDTDPVIVTFTVQGQRATFSHHSGRDDFLRLAILKLDNCQLRDPAYRFEACDDYPGDGRFVVCLHREERAQLQQIRGWTFCDYLTR